MSKQPELETARLLLRPFILTDSGDIQRLAGDRAVADTTLRIPHPYEDGMAEEWLGTHRKLFDEGKAVYYAVSLKESGRLIGSIGLELNREHEHAELGYWIAKDDWNKGYASEAALKILEYAFCDLGLERVHAHHFTRNPASASVLENIGMKSEGLMRKHVKKWGKFEDIQLYGILREEFEAGRRS
jgi:RimJ/RimL family protein N-acetyltransferase